MILSILFDVGLEGVLVTNLVTDLFGIVLTLKSDWISVILLSVSTYNF